MLSKTSTAFVLDGTSSLVAGGRERDLAADNISWEFGKCLPSAGKLTYTDNGEPIAITYLPTTPVNGLVQVEAGGQTFMVPVPCL